MASRLDGGIEVAAQDGGRCGVYIEKDGQTEIIMAGSYQEAIARTKYR